MFQEWTHHSFKSCFFHILGTGENISPQETKGAVSLSANIADIRIPSQITCNCYTNLKVMSLLNIVRQYFLHHRNVKLNLCKNRDQT